jgi:DNA segregation ATPase FtsK/SpoIIIE, S-DNA-T family
MTIRVSVADVRAALSRAAGPHIAGIGEPSTMLLGRIFHEVFADLVSADPVRSGLRVIAESPPDAARCQVELLAHTWRRLLAPRLSRNGAALQDSTSAVLSLWKATHSVTAWLSSIALELINQHPRLRGRWAELAAALQAEVPLTCELNEPGWTEPVQLFGFADSILRLPESAHFCAIELKLGRTTPVVDLGQAALYHLILTRSASPTVKSALALIRFVPEREERLLESAALSTTKQRLLDLIGSIARVLPDPLPAGGAATKSGEAASAGTMSTATIVDALDPSAQYAELGKRLARAFREHGVGIELRGEPTAGARFLRFEVRLTPGMKLGALRRCTGEVRLRLELNAEPMITQDIGRLYVDVERSDPQTVLFSDIVTQLAPIDALYGSARILIGIDPAQKLRFADLSSSGRSHVLAAGTTGSGKSEWLRMMLASLIVSNTPETLRVVTLDPKLAAFTDLERSPFLWKKGAYWVPGDGVSASELFQDLIEEMDRRYQLTRQSGADNLRAHVEKTARPLPRIVCVCDEYFALISQNRQEKAEIENAVSLLGAKARAAGIHLVLATQQPSRATITGAIQANLPCRVALALSSHIESTMILGTAGAERLTGSGDLLYKDFGDPVRLQAPYLSEEARRRYLGA